MFSVGRKEYKGRVVGDVDAPEQPNNQRTRRSTAGAQRQLQYAVGSERRAGRR